MEDPTTYYCCSCGYGPQATGRDCPRLHRTDYCCRCIPERSEAETTVTTPTVDSTLKHADSYMGADHFTKTVGFSVFYGSQRSNKRTPSLMRSHVAHHFRESHRSAQTSEERLADRSQLGLEMNHSGQTMAGPKRRKSSGRRGPLSSQDRAKIAFVRTHGKLPLSPELNRVSRPRRPRRQQPTLGSQQAVCPVNQLYDRGCESDNESTSSSEGGGKCKRSDERQLEAREMLIDHLVDDLVSRIAIPISVFD